MFGNMVTLYLATVPTTLPKKTYVLCGLKTAITPISFQTPCASSHSLLRHLPCARTSLQPTQTHPDLGLFPQRTPIIDLFKGKFSSHLFWSPIIVA